MASRVTPKIAIIGSGFCGTVLACQLIRKTTSPIHIHVFEKSNVVGLGTAYQTRNPNHLLNVPAAKMSALSSLPEHFVNWLQSKGDKVKIWEYYPRRIYGEYLQFILKDAQEIVQRTHGIEFSIHQDEVLDAGYEELEVNTEETRPHARRIWIRRTQKTEKSYYDTLVLATGVVPSGRFAEQSPILQHSDRFIRSFWTSSAIQSISSEESVGILGTGLTMVDAVVSLLDQGHVGPITAFSRRGILPQAHEPVDRLNLSELELDYTTPLRMLREFRAFVAKRSPDSWRDVLDAFRPVTDEIWNSWGEKEKKQFIRHLRPYWESHRHRMARPVRKRIDEVLKSGQLQVVRARISKIEAHSDSIGVQYTSHNKPKSSQFSYLLDCAGPGERIRASQPLIGSLIEQGVVQTDELGMGLITDEACRVWNPKRAVWDQKVFALGALRKGSFWETIAVPELRDQVNRVADEILGRAYVHIPK